MVEVNQSQDFLELIKLRKQKVHNFTRQNKEKQTQ